jgi:hypothetical protein
VVSPLKVPYGGLNLQGGSGDGYGILFEQYT